MIGCRMTGVRAVKKAFDELGKKLARKVIRDSMRSALRPMLRQIRASAPKGKIDQEKNKRFPHMKGFLRKAIKIKVLKAKREGEIAFKIGTTKEAAYGTMVEAGTKKQRGQHFMQRVFDSNGAAVVTHAIQMILSSIEEALRG